MMRDARAKQALYASKTNESSGVPRGLFQVLVIVGSILIALAIFLAFLL